MVKGRVRWLCQETTFKLRISGPSLGVTIIYSIKYVNMLMWCPQHTPPLLIKYTALNWDHLPLMTRSERTKIVPNGCSFSRQCLVIQTIAKSTRDQIILNIINNYTVPVPWTSHDWVGIRERPRIRRGIREWNGIRSRIRWQSRIRIWQRGWWITTTGYFTENAWTSQLLPNCREKRAALEKNACLGMMLNRWLINTSCID